MRKSSRCTVCNLEADASKGIPSAARVDRDLLSGSSVAAVMREYPSMLQENGGPVSRSSFYRHAKTHLQSAIEIEARAPELSLSKVLEEGARLSRAIAAHCSKRGDHRLALQALVQHPGSSVNN